MGEGPARWLCVDNPAPGLVGVAALTLTHRLGAVLPSVQGLWQQGQSALTVLPPGGQGMNPSYDEYADSDEDQHDAYLERMKEEGKIREENANDSSDESGEETGGPASAGPGPGAGRRAGLGVWGRGQRFCGAQVMPSVLFSDESFNPGEEEEDLAEE